MTHRAIGGTAKAARLGLLIVAALAATAGIAHSQTASQTEFDHGGIQRNRDCLRLQPFEHIDTQSGNVIITIPMLTVPGDAGHALQFTLTYNTSTAVTNDNEWAFGLASNFGRSGYGYLLPGVAAIAAVGSVAQDAFMFAAGGELAALRYVPKALSRAAGGTVAKDAFETAQAGGRHSGMLTNYLGKSASELKSGSASFEKQIATHLDKIKNPGKYIDGFEKLDPRQHRALINKEWPSQIQQQREQLEILRRLLEQREQP